MINYMLVKNSSGNVIFSRYYKHFDMEKKVQLQNEVISLCASRARDQSTIVDYEDYTVVFQKFSAVTFIAGISRDENELAVLELFRHFCETLIKYLGSLTELHFVTNLDKVHMVLDEMILNGNICETSQARILAPLQLMTTAKR